MGYFEWLGTRGGRRKWKCPAGEGLVGVTASIRRFAGRGDGPEALLGFRKLIRSVGNRVEYGDLRFDVGGGKAFQLGVLEIAVEEPLEGAQPEGRWRVQGRIDEGGEAWTELKIKKFAVEELEGGAVVLLEFCSDVRGGGRFRIFRVLETDANGGRVVGVEFFGSLFRTSKNE